MMKLAASLILVTVAAMGQETNTVRMLFRDRQIGSVTVSAGWVVPTKWSNASPVRVWLTTTDPSTDAFRVTLTARLRGESKFQVVIVRDKSTTWPSGQLNPGPFWADIHVNPLCEITGLFIEEISFSTISSAETMPNGS